jgi:hypothetical protein
MLRCLTVALTVVLLAAAPGGAEEKKKDAVKKPIGTWTRSAGEAKITFAIKADTLKITLARGDTKIEADADIAFTKDGYLFGRLSKVEKPGGDGPSEGDLFSFLVKMDKDKITLSELKTSGNTSDEARQLVEGEYEKAK